LKIQNEIQEEIKSGRKDKRSASSPQASSNTGTRRKKRNFVPSKTRAPARSNPEIPILSVLSKSSLLGLQTKVVLKEVASKWFKELSLEDLMAVYPESKKKIVETIIKFSRKNLIGRGEIHPVSEENFGTWRATSKGIERALEEGGSWVPKYVEVNSMIEARDAGETL
jgi:hypothetical protein